MKYLNFMNVKSAAILMATYCTVWSTTSIATDFDIFSSRIIVDIVDSQVRSAKNAPEYIDLTDKATIFLQNQTALGCWNDIDYSDTFSNDGWEPSSHLVRILTMSSEYETNKQTSMRDGVIKGLECWYKNNVTGAYPSATNWWWNEIGKQKYLGPVGLIMANDLSASQLANIIADMPTAPYLTGANRSDISKAVVFGGLLGNDSDIVNNGISGIIDTVVTTEDEGMQVDMSWLQHGPQLQNGSYGLEWRKTALHWAYYVRDLQWSFPADKSDLIANYILEGDQWMTRPGGGMDYSAVGRSVSRAPRPALPVSTVDVLDSEKVAALSPTRATEAQGYQNFLDTGVSSKTGFKHFWRADYSVSKRANYTFTIHMSSTDVALQEHGLGENELGYWMGFGNTFLYQNGKEYKDIFPVWRWDVMSGVTTPHVSLTREKLWGKNFQNSTFVGATTDGQYGVTVMDFVHTDPLTSTDDTFAKKAWFSFEDEIVALGAGISSTRSEYVSTTLNETLLNGPVTVDNTVYPKGSRQLINSKWVHHDNVAYVFPAKWYGHMDNNTQIGDWADLNVSNESELISKDTFFLRMGHSYQPTNASYQYIIVPGVTTTETQAYSDAIPVSVLENSKNIQAVRHAGLNMTGIVFHKAGSIEVYPGLIVSANKPSVLLLDESEENPVVSLSTPGTSDTVQVTLSSTVFGQLIESITTPSTIAEKGKSVTTTFDASAASAFFTPTNDNRVRGGTYSNTNYGESPSLVVKKTSNINYDRNSFLKWDLNKVPVDTVIKAEIKLHVSTLSAATKFDISQTADNWDEASLTWNKAPAIGKLIDTKTATTIGQWITVDVTNYVNSELSGDKQLSTALTSSSADEEYLGISSVEANEYLRPQLALIYPQPPIILSPTDDNRVRGGNYADKNYGEANSLVVKDSSSISYDRNSYLQWDLDSLTASKVTKAEIKLHVSRLNRASAQFNISQTGDNWDESTLTWNNAPAVGPLISNNTVTSIGEWVTIDVTSYLNAELEGDKILSTVLTPATANEAFLSLSSVEADEALRPQLVITR